MFVFKKMIVKKLNFLFFILCFFLLISAGSLFADQQRQDVFKLGYNLGRAVSMGLDMNALLSSNSQIYTNIRRCLGNVLSIAGNLGLPTESIRTLLRDVPMLSRQQYLDQSPQGPRGRSRVLMDELQQQCRDRFGEQAALIFSQGVWLGGAEGTADYGQGYTRETRPGTYDLLRRNVTWLQGNAGASGLSQAPIDRLDAELARGITFGQAFYNLESLRRRWLQELLDQPSLSGSVPLVELSDSNWNSEVGQSPTPVLVVFCSSFDANSGKQVKVIEGIAGKYPGVKFAKADMRDCRKIFQQEGITAFPIIRLYKNGRSVGQLQGKQNEEAIANLIGSGQSSGGLLGVEMGGTSWD